MNKIEDIFDVLLEGTKAQIDALEGCGASYRYSMESGTFTVSGATRSGRTSCSTRRPARGGEGPSTRSRRARFGGLFCRQKNTYIYIL